MPCGDVATHANLDQLCHISDNLFSSWILCARKCGVERNLLVREPVKRIRSAKAEKRFVISILMTIFT